MQRESRSREPLSVISTYNCVSSAYSVLDAKSTNHAANRRDVGRKESRPDVGHPQCMAVDRRPNGLPERTNVGH